MKNTLSDRHKRILTAVGIFLGTFYAVFLTVGGPGLAWDEAFYLGSVPSYSSWFGRIGTDATRPAVLAEHWEVNHEHPPLAKLVSCAAIGIWGKALGFHYAARIGTGALFALLVTLVFLFMATRFDLWTGVFAALSLALMPRVFGQAHLTELDLPMALAWFATAITFVKAAEGGLRWCLLSGLVFGLALLTKINAFAIPPILILWGLLYHRWKALPACLALALGLPVFFLGWPWLWFDTIPHLTAYLNTLHPAKRCPIPVYYLWQTYGQQEPAPVHYPLVLTLATLPAVTAIASLGASVRCLRNLRKRPLEALLAMNAGFILLSSSMPGVPKYDGVRLFLPAFPFIACLAGLGLRDAHRWLITKLSNRRNPALILAGAFLWQAFWLAWFHPFYLSDYGGLVGCAPGAYRIFGLESTYWSDAVDETVFDQINERAPRNGKFAVAPYERIAMDFLKAVGCFREDLREVPVDKTWDIAVLNCRQGLFGDPEWNLYRRADEAVFAHRRLGVPLCLVFDRSRLASPPGRPGQ